MSTVVRKISLLTNDECGEFRKYKNKMSGQSLTFQLFNIYRDFPDLTPKEYAIKLYGTARMGSYRQAKMCLAEELDEFIVIRRIKMDRKGLAELVANIVTADYWMEKGAPELAWTRLKAAAKLGSDFRHHSMMEQVYDLMLTLSGDMDEDPVAVVMHWKTNSNQVENEREVKLAQAMIERKVKVERMNGGAVDAKKVFQDIKEDFDLPQFDENNPQFVYMIAKIVRKAMVSNKEYAALYEFLWERYSNLEEINAFSKFDQEIKLGFMFMLAHASYRTWKFEEAENWISKMEPNMPMHVFQSSHHYFKVVALNGLLLTLHGKNSEAINLIEKTLEFKNILHDTKDVLNLRINLVLNYAHAKEFRKALRLINKIESSNQALMANMGKEWCLKRDMIKLMIFWELGDFENAFIMYRNIDKGYKTLMGHDNYKRAKPFLKCVLALIKDPMVYSKSGFRRRVELARKSREGDVEDIQAVAFFVWVRSKLDRREYYPYLLERIKLIRIWMGLLDGEVDDSQLRV